MDQQQKQLVGIILRMIRDIYKKTIELETMFKSNSIHILARDFDPFNELLQTFGLPEEKNTLLLELVQLYLEDEMTLNELLLEFENQTQKLKA
ncbi:MAG: hypothetical protein WBZ33_00175 [Thermoactinomyces sp.]